MRKTLVLPIFTLCVSATAASKTWAAEEPATAASPSAPTSASTAAPPPAASSATAVSPAAEVAPQTQPPTAAAPSTPAAPADAAATNPPGATPAEEAKPVPSYFRLDHDYLFGLQLWAGATYPITEYLGIATDIYIAENYLSGAADAAGALRQSYWGEFDIGPALTVGKLTVTPMVGIAFDWAAKRAVAINGPQLYTVFNHDKIYFESWIWTMLYSAMHNPVANDYFHTRNWVLYKLNEVIALGPQLEYTYDLDAKHTTYGFPVGGHVELAYGAGNSLGLFLGYDTKKSTHGPNDTAAVGRLTFVHNF